MVNLKYAVVERERRWSQGDAGPTNKTVAC